MTKIAVWGDSIARGVVLDEDKERYIMQKVDALSRAGGQLGAEVRNFAKFGCTIAKGWEYMQRSLEKWQDCDTVVLEFGGNDSNFDWARVAADPDGEHTPGTPLDEFEALYTTMLREIRAAGKRAIAMTLPPVEVSSFFAWVTRAGLNQQNILRWLGDVQYIYRWHERYNAAILRAAQATGSECIDIRREFLNVRRLDAVICRDGMHPNAEGYSLVERAVLNYAQTCAI